jgi:hypothetical protein
MPWDIASSIVIKKVCDLVGLTQKRLYSSIQGLWHPHDGPE